MSKYQDAAEFFEEEEHEKQPEEGGGAEIKLTEGQLSEIIADAVKSALEDDRKRREEEAELSTAARIAREHCRLMNGER